MTQPGGDEQGGVRFEPEHERDIRKRFARLMADTPVPAEELIDNLALYLRREPLIDLLCIDALYRMILDIPGVIMEFGVQWGRNLGAFTALRSVYEPYNPHRRVIGFDTFTGFPALADIDRVSADALIGGFAVSDGYPRHLRDVLSAHEAGEYLSHIKRTLVLQGEVGATLPHYLQQNPHTVIALAYFDLDLHVPTRDTLLAVRPYLTKGSILAFDEFVDAKWPGETAALREVFGIDYGELRVLPGRGKPSYFRWPGGQAASDRLSCQASRFRTAFHGRQVQRQRLTCRCHPAFDLGSRHD